MKRKILFVIPTLFAPKNKKRVVKCIERIHKMFGAFSDKYRIIVLANEINDNFKNWKPEHNNVEKTCSHLQYNIAKALNTGIKMRKDEDYFCYVDEGIRINSRRWLPIFIDTYEKNERIGIISVRGHSTDKIYKEVFNRHFFKNSWGDGIMLVSFDRFAEEGIFDEQFFGDKELADFGVRLFSKGYTNLLYRKLPWEFVHNSDPFERKVDKDRDHIFLEMVRNSEKLWNERWQGFFNDLIRQQKEKKKKR